MVYTSLEDYSFCILITLDFIKPYGNIMNLYAFSFVKSKFYWTIFSCYYEWFAIPRLPPVDNYLWIMFILIDTIYWNDYKCLMITYR